MQPKFILVGQRLKNILQVLSVTFSLKDLLIQPIIGQRLPESGKKVYEGEKVGLANIEEILQRLNL